MLVCYGFPLEHTGLLKGAIWELKHNRGHPDTTVGKQVRDGNGEMLPLKFQNGCANRRLPSF